MSKKCLPTAVIVTLALAVVIPARGDLVNFALGGTATQSTTPYLGQTYEGLASNAIDGDTNGSWYSDSVTHTDYGYSWWLVDLGGAYDLSKIDIWNRTDYAPGRLAMFWVRVFDESLGAVWSQYFSGPIVPDAYPSHMLSITLPGGTSGRYVQVSFEDHQDYLSLAEVQVWGEQQSEVPEPATWGLAGILAPAFLWRLRARRRSRQ
jgi:hypothetical protein